MAGASPKVVADRHVVTVVFRVRDEHVDEFRRAVLANAAASLSAEPGCLVFDVCENADRSQFFLYELYESAAAFDEHLNISRRRISTPSTALVPLGLPRSRWRDSNAYKP
jgi:quinol monooxygenase YgiN